LCKLAFKIIHFMTIILQAWQKNLSECHMTVSFMPRDVATHWNSTFDMLEYALKHWRAVNVVTQQHEPGLRKFELSYNEWLVILKHATLFFSCSMQNLATVIPAMDHIDKQLTMYACNKKYL
ncbi:hypothetical protein PAXRUDRAFT_158694, partial [Paxillus rubicundulus Ve08.2h10]